MDLKLLFKPKLAVPLDRLGRLSNDWLHGRFLLSIRDREYDPKSDAFRAFAMIVKPYMERRKAKEITDLGLTQLMRINAMHHVIFSEDEEREKVIKQMPAKEQPVLRELAAKTREGRAIIAKEWRGVEERRAKEKLALQNFSEKRFADAFFEFGSNHFGEKPGFVPQSKETWKYARQITRSDPHFENSYRRFVTGMIYQRLDPATIEEVDALISEQIEFDRKSAKFVDLGLPQIRELIRDYPEKKWSPNLMLQFLTLRFYKEDTDRYAYIPAQRSEAGWEVVYIQYTGTSFDGVRVYKPTQFSVSLHIPRLDWCPLGVSIGGSHQALTSLKFKVGRAVDSRDKLLTNLFGIFGAFAEEYFGIEFDLDAKKQLLASSQYSSSDVDITYQEEISRPHWSEPDWVYIEMELKRKLQERRA